MSDPKTKPTKKSAKDYVDSAKDEQKRVDGHTLLKIFKRVTKKQPVTWGRSIVGFGSYHYKYASGREGDWMMTGFSLRVQNISLYIMPGAKKYTALLKKLGPHKTGVGCLYVKRLSDIDLDVLEQIIARGFEDMKKGNQGCWL